MIIQKSPHHILNSNKVENINVIETDLKDTGITQSSSDEFSFWSWFKGLVNPLQNLPLISGIYSSVNSENEESDRDLVQNSLGGFLYGGPIGAIVGFGTWAFNKIFDKTPTEMALDASGISDIWKDDRVEGNQLAKNKEILRDNNLKLHIQFASSTKTDISKNISNAALANSEKKKLAQLPESKITESKINSKSEGLEIAFTKKNDVLNNLNLSQDENLVLKKTLNNTNSSTNEEIDTKFRDINFSYPAWKPNDKTRFIRDLESIKKEYEKLGDNDKKKELNIDA